MTAGSLATGCRHAHRARERLRVCVRHIHYGNDGRINGTAPYVVQYWTNSGAGNTVFASAGSSATAPYDLNLGSLSAGTYNLYATVTDENGAGLTVNSSTNTFCRRRDYAHGDRSTERRYAEQRHECDRRCDGVGRDRALQGNSSWTTQPTAHERPRRPTAATSGI